MTRLKMFFWGLLYWLLASWAASHAYASGVLAAHWGWHVLVFLLYVLAINSLLIGIFNIELVPLIQLLLGLEYEPQTPELDDYSPRTGWLFSLGSLGLGILLGSFLFPGPRK